MWTNQRVLDLLGITLPIIQAPMVGQGSDLAKCVSEAGGLGSLACAVLTTDQVRAEISLIRQHTQKPFNVNYFCHKPPVPNNEQEAVWRARLSPFYQELGLDPQAPVVMADRAPFDDRMCELIENLRPPVVSFHFGLPEKPLMDRVKASGARILASATTVREAQWLEAHGVDAVIAQGAEAGGHRGMFLTQDVATQVGTFALVPQVVDALGVPVIAAGGIADARGVAAAMVLGAAAVQIGTAYLFCHEAKMPPPRREALRSASDDSTSLTNVFTGRPARAVINRALRDLGPISAEAPEFPLAARSLQPLRAAAEERGSADFSPVWSGQAARLAQDCGAAELTERLSRDAMALFSRFGATAI
jgi:nitronate monooxygenase